MSCPERDISNNDDRELSSFPRAWRAVKRLLSGRRVLRAGYRRDNGQCHDGIGTSACPYAGPKSERNKVRRFPLREYRLSALRQTLTYVPQKSILFDGSLRENLLYARPKASKAELHQVIAATQLQRLCEKLTSEFCYNAPLRSFASLSDSFSFTLGSLQGSVCSNFLRF